MQHKLGKATSKPAYFPLPPPTGPHVPHQGPRRALATAAPVLLGADGVRRRAHRVRSGRHAGSTAAGGEPGQGLWRGWAGEGQCGCTGARPQPRRSSWRQPGCARLTCCAAEPRLGGGGHCGRAHGGGAVGPGAPQGEARVRAARHAPHVVQCCCSAAAAPAWGPRCRPCGPCAMRCGARPCDACTRACARCRAAGQCAGPLRCAAGDAAGGPQVLEAGCAEG